MGKDKAISKRLVQVDYQKAELAALDRLLVVSEGTFSLSIAVCNSPALRDHIIERIKTHSEGITVIKIVKEVTDIFGFVKEKTDGESQSARTSIFILDVEKAVPSDNKEPKLLRALNVTRELWKVNYSCPIVFWVPEYIATLISKHAPDLWSWVSHHFEFVSEQAGAISGKSDAYAGDIGLAGNLDLDEKQFRIAELEQRIKDAGELPKEDIAQYVNIWLNELGYIYFAIGELDKAEQMLNKALQINEKLGRLEGMATDYGNLGIIYLTKGELNKAEEMQNKALDIYEKLSRLEGIARQYGNLGVIYQTKDELDKAEQMHNKALEIAEKLGLIAGTAGQYLNLGVIYRTRGELDKAEQMINKAVELNKKLGRLEGIAIDYGNLGMIYKDRGELDRAEEIFQEGLKIDEKLGRLEGIASKYSNLGSIYKMRGDSKKARQFWEKARNLYKKIGMPHMVKKIEGWIEGLDKTED